MADRGKYTLIFYLFFTLTFVVIFFELINAITFKNVLLHDSLGLEDSPALEQMAKAKRTEYMNSQSKGSGNRIITVFVDMIKTIFLIFLSLMFLNGTIRNMVMKISQKNISLIRTDFRELKKSEINYLCLFINLYILNKIILYIITNDDISHIFIFKLGLISLTCYFLFIPLIIYLSYILLQYFGKKIIIACYLAYIIKIIPDVFINDEVNLEKMEQVDIKSFPDDIQHLLNKYHLEESVFKEIEPGTEKNAALIGYGKGARMEIYGDFEITDKDELFSVFLHEIGHAKENTLLRKTLVYISLLILELCVVLFIYEIISRKYVSQALSVFTSFIALLLIYRMVLRQWLIMFYKVVSQQSEINSDMFAKEHHYGNELATALFNIVLESNDFLKPTMIYNFFRSGHPAISTRIEYLTE
ncbi:Metalloprotease [Pseudoloma neurophilia]|uniref:Metalloprotease n=1 Tax=Pseudoloma neurophilia TaxID=146866 RepID=A0A0R0LTE2_9MICR|nr:Metalloprotease [Pseudoloma neurophilia]